MSLKNKLLVSIIRSSKLSFLYRQKRFYSSELYRQKSNFQCLPYQYPKNWKVLCSNHVLLRVFSHSTNEEHKLTEQQRTFIDFQPLKFEDVTFEQPVSHEDLLATLQKCKSLQDQMETLTSTLSLSTKDVQKRLNFVKSIETFLKPFFGEFEIQIFGSTMNGFGFKGCDIDMSFQTIQRNEEIYYLESPDVPLVSEVLSGKVSPYEISQLPPKEQLLFIHSLLLEYYNESSEPAIFINAHVPLVRFHHDKFNLKCDLSCRNSVAFANSKLLYLFAKLDKRVKPFMMTIRYWAKHVELIGKGLMFNTYTISLMVIYFLQTRNPPILPSVEYIMSLSNSLEIDDMSDESFLSIRNQIPASENNQSLDELLKDFFFSYFYFDFTRVICPLIASSIPREEFFTPDRSKKFRNNTICVQDPMLVTHNVADLVDFKHCHKFYTEVMCACNMFQNGLFLNPSDNSWGLVTLFDKPENYDYQNVKSQITALFSIPFISANMKVFDQNVYYKEPIHSAQGLLKILQDVLLFDCQIVEFNEIFNILKKQDKMNVKEKKMLEHFLKSQAEIAAIKKRSLKKYRSVEKLLEFPPDLNIKQFQELNSSHELILCAECKTSKNTWHGRDFVSLDSFTVNSLKDLLEKERLISVATAKRNERTANQNSKQGVSETKLKQLMFLCECYKPKNSEDSLLVNLRVLERTYFNPVLSIFLKDFLPKIIKKINSSV